MVKNVGFSAEGEKREGTEQTLLGFACQEQYWFATLGLASDPAISFNSPVNKNHFLLHINRRNKYFIDKTGNAKLPMERQGLKAHLSNEHSFY